MASSAFPESLMRTADIRLGRPQAARVTIHLVAVSQSVGFESTDFLPVYSAHGQGEAEGAECASRHLHQVSLRRLLGVETRQFDPKAGTSAETMCRRIAAPSAVHIRIQRFQ
jgi:hypothetical protein